MQITRESSFLRTKTTLSLTTGEAIDIELNPHLNFLRDHIYKTLKIEKPEEKKKK